MAGVQGVEPFVPRPPPVLTPAEARVLEEVALGLSTPDIARRLFVSRQAISYHIGNLLAKFQMTNRAGLIARAYFWKVLDSSRWPPVVCSERDSA